MLNDSVVTQLQKCPFEAIQIINLPRDLEKDTTHRYGANTFKLHRFVYLLFFLKQIDRSCSFQTMKSLSLLPGSQFQDQGRC